MNESETWMKATRLTSEAASLPAAWKSRILGSVGGANLKVIRMDGGGIPLEVHDGFDEAILVVEGELDLEIGGEVIRMTTGDFFVIPAGKPHRVLEGSRGTLFLVDAGH